MGITQSVREQFAVCIAEIQSIEELASEAERIYQHELAEAEEHLAPYKGARDNMRAALEAAKTRLKELGAETYACTQEKLLPGGVKIREVTRLRYDPWVALEWAKEHTIALELATKEFEAIAKTLQLPFVREELYPQVTLPKSFLQGTPHEPQ